MDNNFSWGLEVDYIAHYGVPHGHGPNGGSGRYPWGSGAKWGKTPLGDAVNRVKGFFKKKKPTTSNVETSEAKREVNTSAGEMTAAQKANAYQDAVLNDKYQLDFLEKIQNVEDIDDTHRLSEYKKYLDNPKEYQRPPEDLMYRDTQKRQEINDLTKDDSDGKSIDPIKSTTPKELNEISNREQHEANRKTALESGDRNQILKYFQESSNEELTRAIAKAGIMDSLNKSINDAKPKSVNPEETSKAQKETYIREALASGDINRILSVAMDPSVNNNDLTNAINKMNTMDSLKDKAKGPTKLEKAVATVDKIKAGLDKTLGYYDTASKVWNTVASNYNASNAVKTGQSNPLGYLMPIPNLKQNNNQKKDENNQKQQQKDQKQDNRDRNLQNQITDLKKLFEDSTSKNEKELLKLMETARQKGAELEKTKTQNQPAKQQSQQVKNEVKSAAKKVSNVKVDDYEKYATSLFPNDDNGAVTPKKTDTLKSYYSYLSSQEIPKWQTMYQSSVDDYKGYNYLEDWD